MTHMSHPFKKFIVWRLQHYPPQRLILSTDSIPAYTMEDVRTLRDEIFQLGGQGQFDEDGIEDTAYEVARLSSVVSTVQEFRQALADRMDDPQFRVFYDLVFGVVDASSAGGFRRAILRWRHYAGRVSRPTQSVTCDLSCR